MKDWWLSTRTEELVKIGANVIGHATSNRIVVPVKMAKHQRRYRAKVGSPDPKPQSGSRSPVH
ncbi:hypothetical protein [Roseiarcus sp.]|uniref:hypothetical protein n=1 Tax=Roseiarcus sp. TaxID=1969460 RepID=UPI003F9D2862